MQRNHSPTWLRYSDLRLEAYHTSAGSISVFAFRVEAFLAGTVARATDRVTPPFGRTWLHGCYLTVLSFLQLAAVTLEVSRPLRGVATGGPVFARVVVCTDVLALGTKSS